jgi:hypothetical protein
VPKFQRLNWAAKANAKKRLSCLGLIEHSLRNRLSRYSIAGSAD